MSAVSRPEPPGDGTRNGESLRGGDEIAAEMLRLKAGVKGLHRLGSSGMMSAVQELLQGDDLSLSQMSALHHLRSDAPLSVGRLAERTGLSLPAASHLTDRLVGRGYALRRENPDDRRAKLLDLSPQGAHLLEQLDRHLVDSYRSAFAGVSPGTLRAAADALERLLAEIGSPVSAQGVAVQTAIAQTATAQTLPAPHPASSPREDQP